MPTARANISAKFIAQIVIPVSRVPSHSAPAVATSPAIESSSGMPAAASEPNATSSTARVSGHDMTSERSIAALFSSLNCDQSAGEPVTASRTPAGARPSSPSCTRPAARTISAVSAPAPPRTTATCPSAETEPAPARGRRTSATAASRASTRALRSTARRNGGSPAVWRGELTTTASA